MAAISMYVSHSDTPQPDGLCPKCWNPALKRYVLQTVDIDGITLKGTRVACRDCKVWLTDLEPLEAHTA